MDSLQTRTMLENRKADLEALMEDVEARFEELHLKKRALQDELQQVNEGIGLVMRLEDILNIIPDGDLPYQGKNLQESVFKVFQAYSTQSLTGSKVRAILLAGGFDRRSYTDSSFVAAVNNAMKRLSKAGKLVPTPAIRGAYKLFTSGGQFTAL
ncbi:hypothetical protein [Verrucomicrobium sp. BvORR106]|uniref:hypothetical protein n=1 Tax=Verrucomicrobium sp. BvORR106 TaxID=1403819 RepID=UPI00056E41DB|nr:hypothetical protein [Verrucomicrobium sp. BvORR106]